MFSLIGAATISYLIALACIVLLTLAGRIYTPRLARHAAGPLIVASLGIVVFSAAMFLFLE